MSILTCPWKSAIITIATSTTVSAEVDLENNADFLQIIMPALTSCLVSVQVAEVSGGTFQDLGDGVTTATTTGSYTTTFKLGGFRFIKIKTSAAQGANRTFTVRGVKN